MSRGLGIALAALATLAGAPATAASAHVRDVGCDRAVGPWLTNAIPIGEHAALRGAVRLAEPAVAERARDEDGRGYGFKIPLAVRRGKVVTVSIARADRTWAKLRYGGGGGVNSVRFTACPRRGRPAAKPNRRNWSSWPGGIHIKRLGCLRLITRERGRRGVQRATISLGMGASCGPP